MICRPQRSKTPESGLGIFLNCQGKSTSFDKSIKGNLKDAIDMNLAGNRRALNKNLEAFVRLSTAFCGFEEENITPDLLKPHPNTYTYWKRLVEFYVRDHYETMPVIIARPSFGKS
ncbi:hypothetical protein CVS40_8260 [Lucilia cuprina]|nr:hypothetical protein CVS40_8260 [Lucilia cuprina]